MRIIFLYGVDRHGRRVLSKRVSRAKLATVAKLPSYVIGMETCSTSHHWANGSPATPPYWPSSAGMGPVGRPPKQPIRWPAATVAAAPGMSIEIYHRPQRAGEVRPMIDREPSNAAESGGASGRTMVLRDLGANTVLGADIWENSWLS